MNIKALNKICFTICIVCIVIGILLGIIIIWDSQDSEVIWKGFGTVAVLFAGSLLTLTVSKAYAQKSRSNSDDDAA
jgi:hypothetical protein